MTPRSATGNLKIEPLLGPVDADVKVPGSKSHTNRAVVCAALASGTSVLDGILLADDTEAMLTAVEALGAKVNVVADAGQPKAEVTGLDPGRGGTAKADGATNTGPPVRVDVRQSGTTGRFLLAVLAGLRGRFVLDGDQQLRSRPFGPQLRALRAVGADIDGDQLPLTINGGFSAGGQQTVAGDVSSQFLSGLLLAAPLASQPTTITVSSDLVSRPYVELTVATMNHFGVTVEHTEDFRRFKVPESHYHAADLSIEPDASAASYFFGAAAITGGRVRIDGLGADTVQGDLKFVRLLERMGCQVTVAAGYCEVTGPDRLDGIEVDMSDISDTVQTMAVVASQARSVTTITGVGFIRNKETDRLAATAAELQRLGIDCSETPDGLVIRPGKPRAGTVRTYDDHRMAMSFTLLGLTHQGIAIADPGCVNKTFPRFFDVVDGLRESG